MIATPPAPGPAKYSVGFATVRIRIIMNIVNAKYSIGFRSFHRDFEREPKYEYLTSDRVSSNSGGPEVGRSPPPLGDVHKNKIII